MTQRSDLIFTVPTCPRCTQEHVDLGFERLGSPIQVTRLKESPGAGLVLMERIDLDLWALCPTMSEPILALVTTLGEVEVR